MQRERQLPQRRARNPKFPSRSAYYRRRAEAAFARGRATQQHFAMRVEGGRDQAANQAGSGVSMTSCSPTPMPCSTGSHIMFISSK
jgi:hypothetical protein